MLRNGNLRHALAFFVQELSGTEWSSGQLKFIENHTYFTATTRKLRDEVQAKNIAELKKKLAEIE